MVIEISILVLAGVVMALSEVIKKIGGDKVIKYIPLFAIGFGLGFSFLFSLNAELLQTILIGLIVGLSATGFYENTIDKFNLSKSKG